MINRILEIKQHFNRRVLSESKAFQIRVNVHHHDPCLCGWQYVHLRLYQKHLPQLASGIIKLHDTFCPCSGTLTHSKYMLCKYWRHMQILYQINKIFISFKQCISKYLDKLFQRLEFIKHYGNYLFNYYTGGFTAATKAIFSLYCTKTQSMYWNKNTVTECKAMSTFKIGAFQTNTKEIDELLSCATDWYSTNGGPLCWTSPGPCPSRHSLCKLLIYCAVWQTHWISVEIEDNWKSNQLINRFSHAKRDSHSTDGIFQCRFMKQVVRIMFQMLLMCAPECPFNKGVNTDLTEPGPLLTKSYGSWWCHQGKYVGMCIY